MELEKLKLLKRMLTGLQPTGVITLGNYIGAIKQMVKYQDEYESFIFVADLHAITVPKENFNLKTFLSRPLRNNKILTKTD